MKDKNSESMKLSKQNQDSQEYDFMREVIKDKSLSKKWRMFHKILSILLGGLLFGVVAAAAFTFVLPAFQKWTLNEEKIKIEQDNPEMIVAGKSLHEDDPIISRSEIVLDISDWMDGSTELIQDIDYSIDSAIVYLEKKNMQDSSAIHSDLDVQRFYGIIFERLDDRIYILIDSDVIGDESELKTVTNSGKILSATRRGVDKELGIAVLCADISELSQEERDEIHEFSFGNSYLLTRGQSVIAVHGLSDFTNSIALGRISSLSTMSETCDGGYHLLSTDISKGDEIYGILLNIDGEIVGVQSHTSILTNASSVKAYAISEIKPVIEKLANSEQVPHLGIYGFIVTEEMYLEKGVPEGFCVEKVEDGSTLEISALQCGDIIVQIGKDRIHTSQDLKSTILNNKSGEEILLRVKRKTNSGYTDLELYVTVG